MGVRMFLSHVHEEQKQANALKTQLESAVPGLEAFASSVDVGLGVNWLSRVDEELKRAEALLVLVSPRSLNQPWINFESGGGWARGVPVIPICHGGAHHDSLPFPFNVLNGVTLHSAAQFETLAA